MQRTDEELDYRDHWQLGLKKAFFNTLTYVEKRIMDDEKRYKLWIKIKRSRFLKRKMLMALDNAEQNKFGVIINRNVKFEIRQTNSAIYECISKTCKPDHDVTAVWKIKTIDSDYTDRVAEPSDEYYATGTKQRNFKYVSGNKRLGRARRHVFPTALSSKRRLKRDTHEKIVDNFDIEEKLDNELDREEVIRYKRNRSLFEQNNKNTERMNMNGQFSESHNQHNSYQSTQNIYPVYENLSPNPTARILNEDPWKPIVTTQNYALGDDNSDSFTRYIQDESMEYLSAKQKYNIPVYNIETPKAYLDLDSGKILESWKAQPVLIENTFKTPNAVQVLPTAPVPKEQLSFLRVTFPKQFDLSGRPLETSTNRNNMKNQMNQNQKIQQQLLQQQKQQEVDQRQQHELQKQQRQIQKLQKQQEQVRQQQIKDQQQLQDQQIQNQRQLQQQQPQLQLQLQRQQQQPQIQQQRQRQQQQLQTQNLQLHQQQNKHLENQHGTLFDQQQQQYLNPKQTKYITPLLPTQTPPESSQQFSNQNSRVTLSNPIVQNGNSKQIKQNVNFKHNEQLQDSFDKPWMSLKIQPSSSKVMVGENSANYANIEKYPPKSNIANDQNAESNAKQFRPRFIEDTDVNLSNIQSHFKHLHHQTKNLPFDIKTPPQLIENMNPEIPYVYKEIPIVQIPKKIKVPFYNQEPFEKHIYRSGDDQSKKNTTDSGFSMEVNTESAVKQWSQVPVLRPDTDGEIKLNQFSKDAVKSNFESTKYRNINSDAQNEENNPGETFNFPQKPQTVQYDAFDIKTQLDQSSTSYDSDSFNNQRISNPTEEIIQTTTIRNVLPYIGVGENKSQTTDAPDQSETEDGEYDGEFEDEYDDYEEEDYENTDGEPQIIKTSIQHCKALSRNTHILTSKKFSIKPMLIFFKTNFDDFVKEHCYLYSTQKDLKILNNDFNFEPVDRHNKRILRSNKNSSPSHKRNFKKKHNYKNYKINENEKDYDESVPGIESLDKIKIGHNKLQDSRGPVVTEPVGDLGLLDDAYRKELLNSKSTEDRKEGVQHLREPIPDRRDIYDIQNLLQIHADQISALKLDTLNFSDDIQGIRRIDDGPYSIIIYPKALLKEPVPTGINRNGNQPKMQSRMDDDMDVNYFDDTTDTSLKNNKKFRFPTEESSNSNERIGFEHSNTRQNSNINQVLEKFTPRDVLTLNQNHKIIPIEKEHTYNAEKTPPNTFKFPQIENFFTTSKTTINYKTNVPSQSSKSKNDREKDGEKIDFPLKENNFKQKGQVINEIYYIPNQPSIHELYSNLPVENNRKHFHWKIPIPQTLSIVPFEDTKNVIVSSHILVGKHTDKNIDAADFSAAPTEKKKLTNGVNENDVEIQNLRPSIINRRHDEVNTKTDKVEFGPILKDGFLPILPAIIETKSNSENEFDTQNLENPDLIKETSLKRTENVEKFITLTNSSFTKYTATITEPLKMTLFNAESVLPKPTTINISPVSTAISNENIGLTNNNFKPSFSFTMYSEPDLSLIEINDTVNADKLNLESQTEDGQFVYTTERTVISSLSEKNASMHIPDIIKIVENKVNLTLHSKETFTLNITENEKVTSHINNNEENKNPIVHSDLRTSTIHETFEFEDEQNHSHSNKPISLELESSPKNTTNFINKKDKEKNDNTGHMMQFFPVSEDGGKESQRKVAEISNKTGHENDKESKNVTLDGNVLITKFEAKKTSNINQNNPVSTYSPNAVLIKNVKNQREKTFLEKNIMKANENLRITLEQNSKLIQQLPLENAAKVNLDDFSPTDSSLFLYKTVTSIIEKVPVTTTDTFSENDEHSNLNDPLFTTVLSPPEHSINDRRQDSDLLESVTDSKTFSQRDVNVNRKETNIEQNMATSTSSYSLSTRTNSKVSSLGKTNGLPSKLEPTSYMNSTLNRSVQNSLEQLKTNNDSKQLVENATIPSDILDKTEVLTKNIIVESPRSYKSVEKNSQSKANVARVKNISELMNNQYLKATTFHPIHFRATIAQ